MNGFYMSKRLVCILSLVLLVHTGCSSISPEQIVVESTATQVLADIIPTDPEINEPTIVLSKPLLFALDDDLYRTDLEGSIVEQLTTGGLLGWGMETSGDEWRIYALTAALRISPDGRRIAFSSNGDTLQVIDTHKPTGTPVAMPGSAVFAWSPDSHYLVYSVHEGSAERVQLMVYDFDAGTTIPLLAALSSDISSVAWSPDGSRVAFGCCFEEDFSDTGEYLGTLTGQLQIVARATGEVETVGPLWRSSAGGIQSFCWTSDNEVIGIETGVEQQPASFCSTPPDSSISPDAQRRFYVKVPAEATASNSNHIQLVVEDTNGELWQRNLENDLWPVAWSLSGDYILLDDSYRQHSPIWRILANGLGEPELIIADGYLLAVVEAWQ